MKGAENKLFLLIFKGVKMPEEYTMKAVLWTKYGGPEGLELKDIEMPERSEGHILIKVRATTVITGDCEMRSLKLPLALRLPIRLMNGIKAPKRFMLLGQEFAGDIVESDGSVFMQGDRVFGATGFGMGTYAQYISLPARSSDTVISRIPNNVSYASAAALPVGGLEALHFLRKADISEGTTILINGAGGSIGTYAIQLAKLYGAHVTAVDISAKHDMMRSSGADEVIDYTRHDFTKDKKKYDVIFDVVGKAPYFASIKRLNKNGIYLLSNPTFAKMFLGLFIRLGSKKSVTGVSGRAVEDLKYLMELVEKGTLKPVIDRKFELGQIQQAHAYVDSGMKKGSLVVTIDE